MRGHGFCIAAHDRSCQRKKRPLVLYVPKCGLYDGEEGREFYADPIRDAFSRMHQRGEEITHKDCGEVIEELVPAIDSYCLEPDCGRKEVKQRKSLFISFDKDVRPGKGHNATVHIRKGLERVE